jgi:hypothetical protein
VLVHKAVRAGFYWPYMSRDSAKIVQNCDKCQHFSNVTKHPPEELKFNFLALALLTMGGRHSRTLTSRKGGVRFVVVAVDYFTKWTEVESLMNITAKSIEQFLWKNVICCYGIIYAFVTDNGM